MDAAARKALATIRRCVAEGRYKPLIHFTQRLDERGLFWSDVLVVLDDPTNVRDGGAETFGRPKWVVSGYSAMGEPLGVVCVLDTDHRGATTLFVTVY